ncbi:HAD family hydrolase [Culicoidibacter larvae]|uniref:HAD family phosphatase n=1 Tax=Culicoidibacter larvae TaxID=2579976 RepID=A0A5R8QEH1_9FIRM|nr:HAD family hydrolase [Culicoidibacter larvae]TLG75366.1 HAD family phosphatase [Culicoidibacter larvae]
MKQKMYVTDLDGTLLFKDKVHDRDVEMLHELRRSGHYMVMATGRNLSGIREFERMADIHFDYYILTNGSTLFDVNHNLLHRVTVPTDIAREIIMEYYPTGEYQMAVSDGDNFIIVEKDYHNFQMGNDNGAIQIKPYDYFVNEMPEISFMNMHPVAAGRANGIERAEALRASLTSRYGDRVVGYRNDEFIDVVPANCSKGNAVTALAGDLGVSLSDTLVIGDSWNDLSMFQLDDVQSYSFDYAEPALHQHAKHIVSDSAAAIRKFLK